MTVKFLDLYSQYLSIKSEIDNAIDEVIRQSAFIGGRFVSDFEAAFAEYQQVTDCVGVANGTDALEIAIESLELPLGSEIIVPANSFIASSEAVTRAGHRVVFCDCDHETYTICVKDVLNKITPATKAIVAVHLYGHPCNMDRLLELSRQHNFAIVEDCAQAHGAEYNGRKVGGIGTIGTFSFYPGKNLGAYGDGGAIVTNDAGLAKKCRMIANHGRIGKYDHRFEGRNSRLDGLQAAVLKVKLKHLDHWIAARKGVAASYRDRLAAIPGLAIPGEAEWASHVWHLFVVRTEQRDPLRDFLTESKIETGIHYPISLPSLEAYRYLARDCSAFFSHWAAPRILSLPIGEHLSTDQVERVIEVVVRFFKDGQRGRFVQ